MHSLFSEYTSSINVSLNQVKASEKMSAQARDSAGETGGEDGESAASFNPPQRKRAKTPPSQISPLLITHVLEQIFYGASTTELTNYRLVCREWNAVATKCLQSRMDFITIGCRNSNHLHSLHYHHHHHQPNANHNHHHHHHQQNHRPHHQNNHHHLMNSISGAAAAARATSHGDLVSPSMNTEQLNRFLQVIAHSTNPPFTKYEIVSSFFVPGNQHLLHRFFQVASPFIQMLKISIDNRAPGEFAPEFLAHLTFPKLRNVIFEVLRRFNTAEAGSLELEAVNNEEMRGNAVSYRILSAISLNAPSLESLEVALQRKCDGEGQHRHQNPAAAAVAVGQGNNEGGGDRRPDGGICPCQHFNLPSSAAGSVDDPRVHSDNTNSSSINSNQSLSGNNNATSTNSGSGTTPSSLHHVVKCHLPLPVNPTTTTTTTLPLRISNSPKLKRLHLRLRNSFIHQSCITALLERLADTLEELCFSEEGHGSRVIVQFPRMRRLSKLTISSICEFEQNLVTILPFNYGEQLPRLSNLNLWDCFGTERRYETLFSSESQSLSMSNIVLPSQFSNVRLAQNIPNVFPNLKSLTMVFSTRTEDLAVIETIFQCCGESLEELHLITDMDIQNQNVDHVLTGLPKEICKKMRMEESFLIPLFLQGIPRKASLVNLKRLKRLIFQLQHKYSRAPLITDVTGYLAFLEMPSLEYLRFTRYGMSWTCLEALSKKCEVDALSPNGNNVFEIETFDFDFEGV